jgi:DNA-binding SARP family transcriptional activator
LGEEPLALPASRQARALLACLATAERPLQRARLCELLWENSPDPRGALRWCLSRLKAVLDAGGAARLVAEDDALWVEPGEWEVDARRLRDLARAAAGTETALLENAVAELTGPFLADLDLNDAIRFESWRLGEEKSLAQARAVVFAEALGRHAGLPEAKLRLAHVWVQQDPLDERPHIAIVESLTALGRKREALAHYERCAQMLRRNGAAPGPALEKARVAIGPLGNSGSNPSLPPIPSGPAPSGNSPVTAPAPVSGRAPISGRSSELARFAALAAAPDRRLRLLAGEPGIGKTRLLEEMGETLAAQGWRVLKGRAFEAESDRAFGPWIDAVRGAAGSSDCPLLRPTGTDKGPSDQAALFESMRAWLAAQAAEAPLALILDDVHWLDAASVALLQYLLRDSGGPFRLALAGIRNVGAPVHPPIDPFLRMAQREDLCETWPIGPLDAAGTASLLKTAGSDRDPAEVFARSAGHPLASLALAMDKGAGPRASLEAMLDERIRLAGEDGRLVLQWASLLGRGVPPALLESLLEMPVHALLAALERLEGQGLMRVMEGEAGMEYLFGHDLIRARAQETLSAPRRARMRAHVAETLRSHPALRRGWEEVAAHAEAGERWTLAAEACLEAGAHCFRLRAFPAMVGFVERGMDLLERTGGHWALCREFCLLSNRACQNLPDYAVGIESRLARLAARAKAAGQEETRLAALYALSIVQFTGADPSVLLEGLVELDVEAGAAQIEDPSARAFSLSGMALCLLATDQEIPKARALLAQSESICRQHDLEEADTRAGLGWLAHRDGRIDEARAHLRKARVLMREKELPQFEFQVLCSQARIELEEENPLEALAHVRDIRALDEVVRHSADRHFGQALEALARMQMGEAGAEALFDANLALLRADNVKVMPSYMQLMRAEREWRAGEPGFLAERCAEAIARCEPLRRPTEPTWARCLLGLSALSRGRRDEAERWLREIEPALAAPRSLPLRVRRLAGELTEALGIASAS